jgi:hypothetical protein
VETFDVEGTTLLSWTIRVQGHDGGEAMDEAQRIAGWVEIASSLATVNGKHFRIVRCRPSDLEVA